jgi:hypothetical protein
MLRDLIQLVLYAVLAAFSPLAFAATMSVIRAGARQALGFAIGFVTAQALAAALLVSVDFAALGSRGHSYPGVRPPVAMVIAVALIWLSSRVDPQPRPPTSEHDPNSRSHALLIRLSRLGFFTTLAAGALLGIGGPKRLVLTALAATLIATSGAGDAGQAELLVLYVAVATVLVWMPVLLSVRYGDRTLALMDRAEQSARRNHPTVTIYALRGLAGLFLIDAIGLVLIHQV